MLSRVAVRGYRSLRELVLPVSRLTVVTGANGTGKSSVYRALRLLADCGCGDVIGSLAREGGVQSARWAGRLSRDRPAEVKIGFGADDFGYQIDLGLPVPARSMFDYDPQIKTELVFAGATPRPASTVVRRNGALAQTRATVNSGFVELTRALPPYLSVLTEFAHPGELPEVACVRDRLRSWRFYEGFRVDVDAPARRPDVGTRTPVLADDGSDLPGAVQTIIESGSGSSSTELVSAVAEAFEGATLRVMSTGGVFDLQLHVPGVLRPLGTAELSDGTLRFLLWATALSSPKPPSLLVLNEPETSLHPNLIAPLAGLVQAAADRTQVLVITHSSALQAALGENAMRIELVKENGETHIDGQRHVDAPPWQWSKR